MANYHDQAQAIWKALDTMLEKDPEGYKKFISEQLREGETVLKKEKVAGTGEGKSPNLLKGLFSPCDDQKRWSTGNEKTAKVTTTGTGNKVPVGELTRSNESDSPANCLSDDAICGASSLLTNMVISKPAVDDEEPEIALNELRIPTDVRAPVVANKKNKPLIEEL
ncbi:PIH1 domain-containing protein 2 [Orchesella cincta]|uniref:PIH1 domain-containing protein 2 n=1 Tax=Orchesella cincta TaxID=48709 RepID=A0A1D2NKI1_ORCCI|nr:PIH1 domain-containing protein 2 [Orchesella cincta]